MFIFVTYLPHMINMYKYANTYKNMEIIFGQAVFYNYISLGKFNSDVC